MCSSDLVEVLDRRPINLLSDVLFLFCLQCELNKDLLKLLIDVVDAQLLKGVVLGRAGLSTRMNRNYHTHLKNFKAKDILR